VFISSTFTDEAFAFEVGARLAQFGLVSAEAVPNVHWQRMKTTPAGTAFLARLHVKLLAQDAEKKHRPALNEPSAPRDEGRSD
jgi:hypothetical protein